MISLFADKTTDEATMQLYHQLEKIDLPEHLNLSINNLKDAESGLLRKDGRVVDISVANCYTLEDVVRQLVGLLAEEPED